MRSKKIDIWKLDPHMNVMGSDMKGIKWLDPKKEPFVISGLPWFKKDKAYRRLPKKPAWTIRKEVDALADCTAGAQLLFRADSKRLAIRVKLSAPAGMYHMPATGQCGFDCYVGGPGKKIYKSTTRFDPSMQAYEYLLFDAKKKETRNITLNFPLYQGVDDLLIGIDKGSRVIGPLPYKNKKKVVFYGTSITQGGCAARPGMAFTNILSRRFNLEFVNLGFSGNGKGEPELARLITEIPDPACFVLDYEGNAQEGIRSTLHNFIGILREKYHLVPILVVSCVKMAKDLPEFAPEALASRAKFQKETVKDLRARGDKNIHYLDGRTLLGKDFHECSVDGVHPTDLGFQRIADGMTPVLRKILKV